MSRNFNTYASLPNCWASEGPQPRENYCGPSDVRGHNNINKSSTKNEDIKESYGCTENCARGKEACYNINGDEENCNKEFNKCENDCYYDKIKYEKQYMAKCSNIINK